MDLPHEKIGLPCSHTNGGVVLTVLIPERTVCQFFGRKKKFSKHAMFTFITFYSVEGKHIL